MRTKTPPVDVNDPDYKARLAVAMAAFKKGCVIHSQTTGLLYTPREFVDSSEKVIHEMRGLQKINNLTFHYPKSAIEAKLSLLRKAKLELDRAEQDVQDLMAKLLTAFEIHPRERKKQ